MQFMTSVIILGALYAVVASGFVVIYKGSRVLNFAYGYLVLLIGYLMVAILSTVGSGLAIFIILLASFLLGLVLYITLIRPMAGQPIFSTIILTIGLGIVLEAIAIAVWRAEVETISFGWDTVYTLWGGIRLAGTEVIIFISAVLVFAGLFAFYRYARIGQQMRAAAENTLLASQRGINIYLVVGLTWGIGVFLTGIAALLLGSHFAVSLAIGHIAIIAFVVALVGGLDSLAGIIPAALLIALAQMAASMYINPRLADVIPFIIMLIILIVRPWGFLGTVEELERV